MCASKLGDAMNSIGTLNIHEVALALWQSTINRDTFDRYDRTLSCRASRV